MYEYVNGKSMRLFKAVLCSPIPIYSKLGTLRFGILSVLVHVEKLANYNSSVTLNIFFFINFLNIFFKKVEFKFQMIRLEEGEISKEEFFKVIGIIKCV
jgi:hypothetical protein